VELGFNYFDTADMYSAGESEVITGRLVKEFCRREETVIATKVFHPVDVAFKGGSASGPKPARRPNMDGLSRKRLMHAVDMSLKRLGTDYIDLYQIHRLDTETPMEETMEALHDIVKSGKVRYLGASSMAAWQFAKMQQVAKENGWSRFISMQSHYNLAYREEEREMIPLCRDQGVALVPWSPLARGFLAGNRSAGKEKPATTRAATDDIAQKYYYRACDFKVVDALGKLATEKNVSNATLAFAWLFYRGAAALAIGVSKAEQIEQAVAALDVALSKDDVIRLEAGYQPYPILGH
jgi:1-deoxyxylulose-5-phosphate synthase